MGSKGVNLCYFVALGEKYLEQFKLAYQTAPKNWNILLITDCDYVNDNIQIIKVEAPESFAERMMYRINIHKLIDINEYDNIWYFDTDILFKGDIIEKVGKVENVTVCYEPNVPLSHPCMDWGISEEDLQMYTSLNAPAINNGMYVVPKKMYNFFPYYYNECQFYYANNPEKVAIEQLVFNKLFYDALYTITLFDAELINYDNKTERTFVNHYIGMYDDKLEKMKKEINKL